MNKICKDCSQLNDCAFINNGLQHRCGVISSYKKGYEDANVNHWHPASEFPPVNKNLISELVLCWCVDSTFHTLEPKLGRVWRGEWSIKGVKLWCYPPKEE